MVEDDAVAGIHLEDKRFEAGMADAGWAVLRKQPNGARA